MEELLDVSMPSQLAPSLRKHTYDRAPSQSSSVQPSDLLSDLFGPPDEAADSARRAEPGDHCRRDSELAQLADSLDFETRSYSTHPFAQMRSMHESDTLPANAARTLSVLSSFGRVPGGQETSSGLPVGRRILHTEPHAPYRLPCSLLLRTKRILHCSTPFVPGHMRCIRKTTLHGLSTTHGRALHSAGPTPPAATREHDVLGRGTRDCVGLALASAMRSRALQVSLQPAPLHVRLPMAMG
ncbi:hypothetical protein C8T65DRAFT_698895, partial [Cerioporus squamosus]